MTQLNALIALILTVFACVVSAGQARSDVVTEWNKVAADITVAGTKSPAMGNHILAMVQTAVYTGVNAITRSYPPGEIQIQATANASPEAAVASASRAMLLHLLPSQKSSIEEAFTAAMAAIPNNAARDAGVTAGERSVQAVVQWRDQLKGSDAEPYRPITAPGVYIPTPTVAGPTWGRRATWVLKKSDQLRPEPPPALSSKTWARDYNEVRRVGEKSSQERTADQTEMALFWQATVPTIYYPVIRSLTNVPGRDLTRNARLFAMAGQAMDDALVAVFEAKYAYHFWRPVTAINNGDEDGNDQTARSAGWQPLIPTPMHPEYPCAHCIVSGALAGILNADLGQEASPELKTTSPNLPGVIRTWRSPDAFAQEVVDARVFDGVHYRTSGDVGNRMGKEIASMTYRKFTAE